jgi:hypothetical protein
VLLLDKTLKKFSNLPAESLPIVDNWQYLLAEKRCSPSYNQQKRYATQKTLCLVGQYHHSDVITPNTCSSAQPLANLQALLNDPSTNQVYCLSAHLPTFLFHSHRPCSDGWVSDSGARDELPYAGNAKTIRHTSIIRRIGVIIVAWLIRRWSA